MGSRVIERRPSATNTTTRIKVIRRFSNAVSNNQRDTCLLRPVEHHGFEYQPAAGNHLLARLQSRIDFDRVDPDLPNPHQARLIAAAAERNKDDFLPPDVEHGL